jgi:hypothetical protein
MTGSLGCDNQGKEMPRMLDPFQFVLVAVAGWMNQRQQQTIEYLRERIGFYGSNSVIVGCASMMTSADA